MITNVKSIILLLILFAVVLFFVGFNLGKRVQRLDQSYIPPAPTPTIIPIPTVEPSRRVTEPQIGFKTLDHECGVSFTYPDSFEPERYSSQEAMLKNDDQFIFVSCTKPEATTSDEKKTILPEFVTIKGQKVQIYELKPGINSWSIKNTRNEKIILFENSKNLTELLINSLEFSN